MKYRDGNYYVEVKDHQYRIHRTENIEIRLRNPVKSPTTQYQVQNDTQIGKNQKVFRNDNNELVVKNYPKKKQPIQQQPKIKPLNCPSCKQNHWLEFDKSYFCQNCEYIIRKQKHKKDKKVLEQNHFFPTRFLYAKKKIRDIWMIEEIIIK